MMAPECRSVASQRPLIFGIPFSHYCQKAEWGLTQAGIDYDYVSISLAQMVRLPDVTGTGLVPAMEVDGRLIEGSDRILEWAADHAATDTDPLYPDQVKDQVLEWEQWADEAIGPVARREAYRVAYNDPWRFTHRLGIRLLVRLARPVILNVLKYYKARRFDQEDADAVPRIIIKVASRLRVTGTGYLLTDHPTAADHSVAALMRPFLYAEPARDYAKEPGWDVVADFIEGMRPARTRRCSRRRIRDSDWVRLADLAKAARPVAGAV